MTKTQGQLAFYAAVLAFIMWMMPTWQDRVAISIVFLTSVFCFKNMNEVGRWDYIRQYVIFYAGVLCAGAALHGGIFK